MSNKLDLVILDKIKNFTNPCPMRRPAAGLWFAAASFASGLLEYCPARLPPFADSSGSCSLWRSARRPGPGACPGVVSNLPPVPVEIVARLGGSHRIFFQVTARPIVPGCPPIVRARLVFAAFAQNPARKIYLQTAGPDRLGHFSRPLRPAAVRYPAVIDPGIVLAAPVVFAGPGRQAPGCGGRPRWKGLGQWPVCNARAAD